MMRWISLSLRVTKGFSFLLKGSRRVLLNPLSSKTFAQRLNRDSRPSLLYGAQTLEAN
jgi:hypothetical protein